MDVTQDELQGVIERVGLAAVMYYPEIHVDDDTYDLMGQAVWCLEPVDEGMPEDTRVALREMVARTIVDPTKHRQETFDVLMELQRTTEHVGRCERGGGVS
ncbi:hypothetical protein [Microbacterium sp. TPU 3598]|uniref:hypothetical protein n=1 Tax=Microbacterium sp. TPU 3598 TaxID=1938334 RepID=UPI000BBA93A6|nr:hypothetical protein [Microbacterium sp. TPU 3598]